MRSPYKVFWRIGSAGKVTLLGGLLWLGLAAESRASSASLDAGWKLQSACVANATGERISSPGYETQGWIKAEVPGTVLGSQVDAGVFAHPFFGMNLREIPGTDYPIGKVFGYMPMSKDSPYRCSWWYRTEFAVAGEAGGRSSLHFDGINYRANVWLNGQQVANSEQVAGAFRAYDFDVTKYVVRGKRNVLAVEVFAQTEKELGIDFLDWNPSPADKSMGLWRGVSLVTSGPVTVAHPAVRTHFTNDDLSVAELGVVADVTNHADHPVHATVLATIESNEPGKPLHRILVEQAVELAALETRVVRFEPVDFTQLQWKNPPVWWPNAYGEPRLERLRVEAVVEKEVSDEKAVQFGIREADGALNEKGFLQFRINRRSILVRGGGWTPDLFYREPEGRLRQEMQYVRHMHLNAIRLEGKLGSDALFDLADEMGILVVAGWQCCDYWQQWDKWSAQDHAIANASTYSQISRLRAHPSVVMWLNGSDEAPSPEAEKEALAVLKERDFTGVVLSSAADRTSTITGKSGVKMSGPYDYVPPEYWYLDKDKVGGAFGFNMETGPGAAVPSPEEVRRTLPKESWWPIDQQWNYHAALGKFAQYDRLTKAMDATYGEAKSLDNYSLKAQLMAYDGERAMFEAYGANKYTSTGVIQWMLNNAWPSFFWHLYDYSLTPGGGYFGTRKANEPVHIQYRYDDRRVAVVNSTLEASKGLLATVKVLRLDGKAIFTHEERIDVAADGVVAGVALPVQSATTFVKLELRNVAGKLVSENFYWVPAQLAELDWKKSTYVNTPAKEYADMQDLAGMQPAQVKPTARRVAKGDGIEVELHNSERGVAFFVHLRAVRAGTEEEIAPVFWEDNFVSLLPGESRTLTVHGLPANDREIEIRLDGWNLAASTVKASAQ